MEHLPTGFQTDSVLQLETNLDDCSGELIGHTAEKLRALGALDVWITPVQMKKNRPGHVLALLCEPNLLDPIVDLLFRETSAFGLRILPVTRLKLRRDFISVSTPFGPVTLKRGFRGDTLLQITPEYESCRLVAEQSGAPLQRVYDAARKCALELNAPPNPYPA